MPTLTPTPKATQAPTAMPTRLPTPRPTPPLNIVDAARIHKHMEFQTKRQESIAKGEVAAEDHMVKKNGHNEASLKNISKSAAAEASAALSKVNKAGSEASRKVAHKEEVSAKSKFARADQKEKLASAQTEKHVKAKSASEQKSKQ